MYSVIIVLFLLQGINCQVRFPSARQENSCSEGQVCRKFNECESAVQAWRVFKELPTTCFFEGTQQYVCCSDKNSSLKIPEDEPPCFAGEVCKKYSECKAAINEWKETKKLPKTCYFEGRQQFVCCADRKIAEEPSKSQQKCDEYNPQINWNPGGFKINVVGGVNAAPREFPFMVALRWGEFTGPSSYLCGGMLISPSFVLTAAHCSSIEGSEPKYARIGGDYLSGTGDRDTEIKRIIVHPKYNPQNAYNDIALIELNKRSNLKPACLWLDKNPLPKKATAIGYGHIEFAGENSKILQKVDLTIFTNTNCKKFYNSKDSNIPQGIKKSQICAGEIQDKKDTCQGDSGGPILTKMTVGKVTIPYLIGVTSFGSFCASGVPAVYTRISEYRKWIENIVWKD